MGGLWAGRCRIYWWAEAGNRGKRAGRLATAAASSLSRPLLRSLAPGTAGGLRGVDCTDAENSAAARRRHRETPRPALGTGHIGLESAAGGCRNSRRSRSDCASGCRCVCMLQGSSQCTAAGVSGRPSATPTHAPTGTAFSAATAAAHSHCSCVLVLPPSLNDPPPELKSKTGSSACAWPMSTTSTSARTA